jgi:putative flavoprotein involved in K+ transport
MVNKEHFEVVIIGGGQAGISLSFYLQQRQIPHVVLERDRAFSSWHNRWDGFRTNTPNWMNTLPMLDVSHIPSNDPNGFVTREEIVDYLEQCLATVQPPIRTGTDVCRITQVGDGVWEVYTPDTVYQASSVAVCTGAMSTPRIPTGAAAISPSVPQLHSSHYQRPDQITTRSVLLVGSASSGVQICRLLAESGRFESIHLAVSNVSVLPQRILGMPTHRVVHFFGLFDVRNDSLLGKVMYSNLETKGDPIMRPAPKDLAKQYGVRLYGKFTGTDGALLHFSDGQTLATDDLTIIWCTGFRGDYSFIEPANRRAAFDEAGYPIHRRGVVPGAPGLYFVGLRYQHTVASHDLYGVGKDAKYVADHIHSRRLPLDNRRWAGVDDSTAMRPPQPSASREASDG